MGSILIVEADPAISDEWATALGDAGHSVHTAVTPRDALAVVKDGGIDVVVIDAYDPRHGIVEVARAIAALPDAPPVVLISGSPEAPEISARMGAAAFVPKPCEVAELVEVANRVVGVGVRPVRVVEDEPSGPARTPI